jgi:hypothetical protein
MLLNQQVLVNFNLMVILALGMLSASSLQVETEPGVDSGTSYATLEESCLISAPGDLLFLPPVNNPFYRRQQPESGDFV